MHRERAFDRDLLVMVRSLLGGERYGPWPMEVIVLGGTRIGLLRRERGGYIEAKPLVWADSRRDAGDDWVFADERSAVEALLAHYFSVIERLN